MRLGLAGPLAGGTDRPLRSDHRVRAGGARDTGVAPVRRLQGPEVVEDAAQLADGSGVPVKPFEALGEVRWRRSPDRPKVRVGLNSGPAIQAPGGTTVQLRVPLPKKVLNRLAQIPRRQSLRARIDVRATNLVPYVGTHELEVKLRGRKPLH